MNLMKKNGLKIVGIVLFCGFLDLFLHALLSPLSTSVIQNPSIFVEHGLTIPAVIVWEILAFSVLALIFLLIQSRLPGTGRRKGFLYGLSFGGLYQIGMLESVLLLKSNVWNELLMGLADFVPILLIGILMGSLIGMTRPTEKEPHFVPSVCVIVLFYLAGRYLAYAVFHIQSAYADQPLETFLWTLCMGGWIGVIHFFLQRGAIGKTAFTQGLFFGAVIFGTNWLMNHLFIAAVAAWSPNLLIRVGTDVVFLSAGAFVCRILFNKSPANVQDLK